MGGEPTTAASRGGARTRRGATATALLAVAASALSLLTAEAVLRGAERFGVAPRDASARSAPLGASGHASALGIPDDALYLRTAGGGLALRPNARVEIRAHAVSGRTTVVRTNALGFRGGPLAPRRAGVPRVLVLGDSVTLGDYVDEAETYPAALARALAARGVAAEVVNAGVGSIGVDDMLPLLAGPGRAADPDLVLVGLYLNDAQRSLFVAPPERWAGRSRLATLASVRLGRWRAERAWTAMMAARQPALDAFLRTHALSDTGDWRTDAHAFDREVAAAFADWGYAWSEAAWRELARGVAALRDEARAQERRVAVALFPVRHQVEAAQLHDEPQRAFAAAMEGLGVPHFDLLPALRDARREPLFYDHCHLTPLGNRIVAEALAGFAARALDGAD
ncbi:MAG: hypothetical protein DCC71_24380 [Proteobacteria bacterium]|nr:MAG: hypothetical protein DCC71_24380 [Pseudomonadota bacterium]